MDSAATGDAYLPPRPIVATESGSADGSKPFETSITTGVVLASPLRIHTCMPTM
jgi:hypothetical protein